MAPHLSYATSALPPLPRAIDLKRGSTRVISAHEQHGFIPISLSGLSSLHVRGPYLLLLAQVSGTSRLSAQEGQFLLQRGDWMVLDPESRPDVQLDCTSQALGFAIRLGSSLDAPRHVKALANVFPGSGVLQPEALRFARRACLRAWAAIASDPSIEASRLEALSSHLATLQADLIPAINRCPGRSLRRKRGVFWRLQRVRMYMLGNCERGLSLRELSALAGMSSWHFSKTFSHVYQETVREALARIRMQRAKTMLLDPVNSVSEVSEACGYPDPCTFARAFKVHHGMSASTWRSACSRWHRAAPETGFAYPRVIVSPG